jgi:hypothetical protein
MLAACPITTPLMSLSCQQPDSVPSYFEHQVRKTQGRGFGLFALEDMEKDRFVIEYMGEVVNKKQYEKRRHQYEVEHNTYFMSLRTEPNFGKEHLRCNALVSLLSPSPSPSPSPSLHPCLSNFSPHYLSHLFFLSLSFSFTCRQFARPRSDVIV